MRILTKRTAPRRSGFTLVELMVSAAVSVTIMAVLATVFQTGIEVMRDMRSLGKLQDQLRATSEIIRRDLQADHFVARDKLNRTGPNISGAKLSDQWLADANWQPPLGGYFHIESDAAWMGAAQRDNDSLWFAPPATQSFLLQFTSILSGSRPQNMYSTNVNDSLGNPVLDVNLKPVSISSRAAEIAYFVDSSNNLRRRQRLVAMSDAETASLMPGSTPTLDPQVVAQRLFPAPPPIQAATLADVVDSAPAKNRMTTRTLLTAPHLGDDVLLSNVLMFEVKVNWEGGTPVTPFSASTTDYPFDYLSTAGNPTFDTWLGATPLRIRVKALQIRLRVFDPQGQTTRQITIIQDM